MIDSSIQDLSLALEMTRHRTLKICDRLNLNMDKWVIEPSNIRVWVDDRAVMSRKWITRVFNNSKYEFYNKTYMKVLILSLDDNCDDPGNVVYKQLRKQPNVSFIRIK